MYEINADGTGLRQITSGPYDDIEPCYLPDGGYVFISSRARRWVPCLLTPVGLIYRCDADGSNIRQLRGNFGCKAENALTVACGGKQIKWGAINGGFAGEYQPAKDGTTILVTVDGSSLAVDFSKASGADAMLVMTGPGAPADGLVEAGGRKFSFRFFGAGESPQPKAGGDSIGTGDGVPVGGQTVAFDGKRIVPGGSGK